APCSPPFPTRRSSDLSSVHRAAGVPQAVRPDTAGVEAEPFNTPTPAPRYGGVPRQVVRGHRRVSPFAGRVFSDLTRKRAPPCWRYARPGGRAGRTAPG